MKISNRCVPTLLALSFGSVKAFVPNNNKVPSTISFTQPGTSYSHCSSSTALNAAAGGGGKVLYGSQGSRSPLCNWGAYELGQELTMGDLSQNPHPFGQIPCLVDEDCDDALVFESGAILTYLYLSQQDALSESERDSSTRRSAILSYIQWANASLDPICFLETPQGKVYDTGLKQPNKRIDKLNEMLGGGGGGEKKGGMYLVDDGGFSIADVAVSSYLLYVLQFFPGISLNRWPNLVAYMKNCASRDAYGKAFGKNVQQYLIGSLEEMMVEQSGNINGDGKEGEEKKKLFGMF